MRLKISRARLPEAARVADLGEGLLAEGQAQVPGQDGRRVAEPLAVQGPALGLMELA